MRFKNTQGYHTPKRLSYLLSNYALLRISAHFLEGGKSKAAKEA